MGFVEQRVAELEVGPDQHDRLGRGFCLCMRGDSVLAVRRRCGGAGAAADWAAATFCALNFFGRRERSMKLLTKEEEVPIRPRLMKARRLPYRFPRCVALPLCGL